MTHILTIHNYSTRAIEGLFDFFSSLYKTYLFSKKVKQSIGELNKLSDKELSDIGLTRGEIYSVVVQEIKKSEALV